MAIRIIVTAPDAGQVLSFYNRGVPCGWVTVPEAADATNLAEALRAGGLDVVDLREPDDDQVTSREVASI